MRLTIRSASAAACSGSASRGLAGVEPHDRSAPARQPVITSSRADDRTDILALEGGEHLAGLEAVDDLQLLAPPGARQVLDDHALDDEIGEVAVDELPRCDARDVRGVRVLLRIVR